MDVPAASIRDKCSVVFPDGECGRIVYNKSLHLCNAHNLQRLRGQEFRPVRVRSGVKEYMSDDCSEPGCSHPAQSSGLCTSHYWHLRNSGGTRRLYQGRRPKGASLSRDDNGNKECSSCLQWKPEDQFGLSKRTLDGVRGECNPCRAAHVQRYYENLTLGEKRRRWLKRRYNKTPQWFDTTLESQGNSCAACGDSYPGTRGWQVDHDHSCCDVSPSQPTCGKCVRGILCNRCNLALGVVYDSTAILDKLKTYLRENKTHD